MKHVRYVSVSLKKEKRIILNLQVLPISVFFSVFVGIVKAIIDSQNVFTAYNQMEKES